MKNPNDINVKEYCDNKIKNAKNAFKVLETYSQKQVDTLAKICAKVVYDNAEELAKDACAETKMGVVADKIAKNKNKAKLVWWSLKHKKSVGIIDENKTLGITKVAKPLGVVVAITPMTNPVVTPMSNSMFAIKGRNPIIIAPHPFAMNVAIKTVNLINKEFEKVGAPKNIIQVVDVKSMDITKTLMSLADVVVATGGAAMVKSVYSSGRPAFGVGAGNVQVLVDSDVDFDNATSMIVNGRSFDNGIICTGEQSVIAPRKHYDKVLEGLEKAGAFVIPNEKRDEFRDAVFPNGEMAREVVGKDAYIIAKSIGIDVPKSTRVLVVEANGSDDILGSEKMFPVLASYKYDSWADAIKIANSNLNKMGAGHSVCVHSNNKEHIKEVSLNVNVSRFVINQVCASSGGGSFFNGLNPTNTLGCGSWGNNSISENLTYYHMFNVSRIANIRTDIKTAPSDNEIWS